MRHGPDLSLLLLAACTGEGDAVWYGRALTEERSYEEAAAACRRVVDIDTRGDCQTAVMEAWSRLDDADCLAVDDAVWRDECLFLLAERRGATGDLDGALATCNQSRFRRSCAWHLLQDEVEASLTDAAPLAEARLARFAGATPIPDAPLQFWLIRFRERSAAGEILDEADCDGLVDPQVCRLAVERHVWSMLDARGRADKASACAAPPGERVTVRGQPAWRLGPLTGGAEASWVAQRCSSDRPLPGRGDELPPPTGAQRHGRR